MRYFEKTAKRSKKENFIRGAIGGAVAGTVASVLTHPIDTLMVNRQANPKEYRKLLNFLKDPKIKLTAKTKSLYRGIGLKAGKNAIAIGAILGINQLIEQNK